MFEPTTHGLGPFHPAIKMNGCVYIHPETFDSENDAGRKALDLCQQMDNEAFKKITNLGYKAETGTQSPLGGNASHDDGQQ